MSKLHRGKSWKPEASQQFIVLGNNVVKWDFKAYFSLNLDFWKLVLGSRGCMLHNGVFAGNTVRIIYVSVIPH